MNPFDDEFVKPATKIADFFNNNPVWSNALLLCGLGISLLVFYISFTSQSSTIKEMSVALSMSIQFVALSISASFPGDTWTYRFRRWLHAFNQKFAVIVIKRFLFEISSLFFIVTPFLIFVTIFVFTSVNGTTSIVHAELMFYYLPVFFVMWIYRFGDYDEFKMNVRRVIVYILVAIAYFVSKDPLTQIAKTVVQPQTGQEFGRIFNEFTLLAFLAFDRIGKVLIEILSRADKFQEDNLARRDTNIT